MIVKVLPAKPAGTGRPLGTYILDLKHENGERLGPYIKGLDTHKVEWERHSNINADSPSAAIAAMEWYNAQNTRPHRVSRFEHIVVSFAEGERPTQREMAIIEDRLMQVIGFGDHPRISAVHRNTDNLHLHIAVSRIDPKTFRAEHPRHNHFRLQAEAARLELDLGLIQERKTLLTRERREIDSRVALERELAMTEVRDDDTPHTNPYDQLSTSAVDEKVVFGGRSYDELGERVAAAHYAAFTGDEARIKELQNRDLAALDKGLKGKLMADESGYTPSPTIRAVDDLAQTLTNRVGSLRDYFNAVRQTERDPLQARAHQRQQSRGGEQKQGNARATPAAALYARFETEKAIAIGERKAAEQAVYQRFSTYQQELSGYYGVRYEHEKLDPRLRHRIERQQSRELLNAERSHDRVEAQRLRSQQLAAARKEHPLPTYDKFLERESLRGDREATRILQQRSREQQRQHGHER